MHLPRFETHTKLFRTLFATVAVAAAIALLAVTADLSATPLPASAEPVAEPGEPPNTAALPPGGGASDAFSLDPYLGYVLADIAAYTAAAEEAARAQAEREHEQRVAQEQAAEAQRAAAEQAEREHEQRLAQEQAARATSLEAPPGGRSPAEPASATYSVWDDLAVCESGGNWSMNSGNGFYGGIQFMHSTWVNMGGRQWAEYPHQATRDQQIEVAVRLQAQYGWGQWPACAAKLGLR